MLTLLEEYSEDEIIFISLVLNHLSSNVLSLSHKCLYTQLILLSNTKVISSLPFSASVVSYSQLIHVYNSET